MRGALGGSRLVLICEQMTESFLICLAGGGAGLLLSLASTYWLAAHWRNLPRADSVHVDGWVLAFTLALVAAAALLAGLVPAISSTGKGLLSGLRESSRTVGGGASRARLRKTMLTVEIALTVVLVISAGLLFKSFLHLRTADLGCRVDHVITMKFGLPEIQYDTRDKVVRFHQSLLERVRRLPGVRGAALVSAAPGSVPHGDRVFTILEKPAPSYTLQYHAMTLTADPQYFSVMQIPLLRGRVFTEHERLGNDHYIVVSKQFADRYFSGDDPVGKHVRVDWDTKAGVFEILGEVGDTVFDVTKPVRADYVLPDPFRHSRPNHRGDDRGLDLRRSVGHVDADSATNIGARTGVARLQRAHHGPDSWQDHGQSGFRGQSGPGLRRLVASFSRGGPIWSALLPDHTADVGYWSPHRPRARSEHRSCALFCSTGCGRRSWGLSSAGQLAQALRNCSGQCSTEPGRSIRRPSRPQLHCWWPLLRWPA